MKKLFTLMAAALMAVSVSADDNLHLGGNAWNVNYPLNENVKITSKGGYAEYKMTDKASFNAADYKGYKIEYSDVTGTPGDDGVIFQVKIISKETHSGKDWEGKDAQLPNVEKYFPLDATKNVYEGNFSDFVATTDETTTGPTIAGFYMQTPLTGASIILKKVVLIKNDGTEEQTTFAGDTWGGGGYEVASMTEGIPTLQFLGQYGGQKLLLEDNTDASYKIGGTEKEIEITFKEATPIPLMIEFDNGGSGFHWDNFDAGVKSIKITLNDETCVKNTGSDDAPVMTPTDATEIWIKANEAASATVVYPATIKIDKIVMKDAAADEGGEEATPAALIDYPTKKDGITISGSCEYATVKIHNADAIDGIKFANSYTSEEVVNDNKVELTVDGGFKKGDVITIAGAFNNSDNTKKAAIDIFTLSGTTATVLFTTKQFINGKTVDADPVAENYTLTADADKLYLGRNGNTATFVTLIKVTRSTTTGIQEIPVKVIENGAIYNLAGQRVNENYKGIVIKNGKKYIQK